MLPVRDDCVESFQWLAQEIRAANGEAAVLRVTQMQGITDQQMVALFCEARAEDYRHIETQADDLRQTAADEKDADALQTRDKLARLRHRLGEISRIDYFGCADGKRVSLMLDDIEQALSASAVVAVPVPHFDVAQYRQRPWVTRPRPHVDRVACVWFIRRFVNAGARIRYSGEIKPGEAGFDMDGGEFGHRGNLCTFEMMKAAFAVEGVGLRALGEIVHEIDLHDGRYARPEVAGVETILKGWSDASLTDAELEVRGVALFEGLYAALSRKSED